MLLVRPARRFLGTLALATLFATSTHAAIPASQRSALLALYDSTGGADGIECTRYGIRGAARGTGTSEVRTRSDTSP